MKNKIQKFLTLVAVIAMSACGFEEMPYENCNDYRRFDAAVTNLLEIEGINFSQARFTHDGGKIMIFMGDNFNQQRDQRIELDFIGDHVGQTTTTVIDNQQIAILNTSKIWDGIATLTIQGINDERIIYHFSVDIQSGSSVLRIEGSVESYQNTYCVPSEVPQ